MKIYIYSKKDQAKCLVFMLETSTNNATKTPFIMKTYKLTHIIQNKSQPEMN